MCPHPSKQNPRPDLKDGAQIADENPGGMAELDLSIVERYADHLERKASGRITLFTIFFALVGSMLGSVPLFPLKYGLIPHHLGYATLLIGAAAGGYLGYTMGARRAEGLRLQAQLTLHQLQLQLQLGQSPLQVAAPVAAVPLSYLPVAPVPVPVAPSPVVAAPVAPEPQAPAVLPPVAPAPLVAPAAAPDSSTPRSLRRPPRSSPRRRSSRPGRGSSSRLRLRPRRRCRRSPPPAPSRSVTLRACSPSRSSRSPWERSLTRGNSCGWTLAVESSL